ncbi:hypothetical protein [Alienimonas sp. DA493]|uniref:hypothetical protein n=1 Tax=Alienimonas sp. DA493 TaxID=3373605 RepID=UPI0037552E59
MADSLPRTRRQRLAWGVGVAVVTLLCLVSGVFRWSELNCRHEEVDLNSGRVRHTRFLLYCQVGERIEETWLSRAVAAPPGPADWRRVNTFSPGAGHSPHYQYHSAIHQIDTLALADEILPFTPDARRQVAERLLSSWRTSDDDETDDYVDEVGRIASARREASAAAVTAADLSPFSRRRSVPDP